MNARQSPYPIGSFKVRVPRDIWEAALDEVRRYGTLRTADAPEGSEGLVYLGGVPTSEELLVTSLLKIRHLPQGDRVQPSAAEIRWMMSQLKQRDEMLVAQFHTHRYGAAHSPGDDEMATSFHEGFLSIVAPRFATDVSKPEDCVFHEYRGRQFRAMTASEVTSRIVISVPVIEKPGVTDSEGGGWWARFAQRLRLTAAKLR